MNSPPSSNAFALPIAVSVLPPARIDSVIIALHCLPLPALLAAGGAWAAAAAVAAMASLAFALHRQRRAKNAARLLTTAGNEWRLFRRSDGDGDGHGGDGDGPRSRHPRSPHSRHPRSLLSGGGDGDSDGDSDGDGDGHGDGPHPRHPRSPHPRHPRSPHPRHPRSPHPRHPRSPHPRHPRSLLSGGGDGGGGGDHAHGEIIDLIDGARLGRFTVLLVAQRGRRFHLAIDARAQEREQTHRLRVWLANRHGEAAGDSKGILLRRIGR